MLVTPIEFTRTIYLGDRACKAICVDGWNRRILIRVDVISRIRSADGTWNFYSEEDITDGCLVFVDATSFRLSPSGPMPDGFINAISVTKSTRAGRLEPVYEFALYVDSVAESGQATEVLIEIEAADLYLQDPTTPELELRD